MVLGGMTGIHQFVRIGESVFTGGNSMLLTLTTISAASYTAAASAAISAPASEYS